MINGFLTPNSMIRFYTIFIIVGIATNH